MAAIASTAPRHPSAKKLAIAVCLILLLITGAGGLTLMDLPVSSNQPGASGAVSGAHILDGPVLESSTDSSAIVRWMTDSISGTAVRYAVIHYGVDPRRLDHMAKSSNRWNSGLPTMIYRVQLDDLEPGLTYSYWVESTDARGLSEGIHSEMRQFTTQLKR
jgi:purple acid phosphatase-like protein